MRILGLVASPRKGGNSELIVKECLRHFPPTWEKCMIRLTDLKIAYCKACYACLPKGKGCILKDDMAFLVEQIRQADKIILAGATYILGGHTSLKCIRDRSLCVLADFEDFAGKDCVIAASYGLKHWDGMVKEDMITFAREFNLHIVDSELFYATLPGEAVSGENLTKVRRLAESLRTGVKVQTETDELLCPYCGGRGLRIHQDGKWRCLLCAGQGTLVFQNKELSLDYDSQDSFYHFSEETKRWHIQILEEKKRLFLQEKDQLKEIQRRYQDFNNWVLPGDTK